MALALHQPKRVARRASPDSARDATRHRSAPQRTTPAPAAAAAAKPERTVVGILALLASVALFPVSDTASKVLTGTLPGIEVAWMRYLVFVVMTVPLLLRDRSLIRTARPGLLAGRAVASPLPAAPYRQAPASLPVSDTHLTLPPTFRVSFSVVAGSSKLPPPTTPRAIPMRP